MLIAAQGVTIVISPGEWETAFVRVFEDLQKLDDRFTVDLGLASTANRFDPA